MPCAASRHMGSILGWHQPENPYAMNETASAAVAAHLIADDEPAPFEVLNGAATQPVLLLCDHASARIPRALHDLGLPASARRSHLAWDIGAADVVRELARRLSMTAVLTAYSRLVVDCNRGLDDAEAFLVHGDGVDVPGNRDLSAAARNMRANAIHAPYHAAVAAQLRRLAQTGRAPVLLSIHSFTPVLDGVARPWEAGILWHADHRLPALLLQAFERAGFVVGDNQPYAGDDHRNFTVNRHAVPAGLAHAVVEMRQDLASDAVGAARMVAVLESLLRALPQTMFESTASN